MTRAIIIVTGANGWVVISSVVRVVDASLRYVLDIRPSEDWALEFVKGCYSSSHRPLHSTACLSQRLIQIIPRRPIHPKAHILHGTY